MKHNKNYNFNQFFYRNEQHHPLLLSPAAKKALVTAAVYKTYHLKVENFPFYGKNAKYSGKLDKIHQPEYFRGKKKN